MASSVLRGDTGARRGGDPFDPVMETLRVSVIEHYRRTGERLQPAAWLNTIETNSGYVPRRGRPMVEMLYRRSGLASLHGLRLLDAGCGFGALAVFFAAQGADVTGIDPHPDRLSIGQETANRHGLPVRLMKGRMEALDFPDQSYDVVVMNNSLCYLVDRAIRAAAIGEALRVLRPGGHLLIRNPSLLAIRDQFTGLPLVALLPPRLAHRAARVLGRPRSYVRLLSAGGAQRELRRCGFIEVEVARQPGSRIPRGLHRLARYQHLIAVRPVES